VVAENDGGKRFTAMFEEYNVRYVKFGTWHNHWRTGLNSL